jgi:exonuclease SbcC
VITEAAIADSESAAAQLDALEADRARLEVELDRCGADRAAVEERYGAVEGASAAARTALAQLDRDCALAADGHPSVAARQQHLRARAEHATRVAAAVSALGTALEHRAEAHRRADAEARERGFVDSPAASAAALTPAQRDAARALVTTWQDDGVRLRAVLAESAATGAGHADRADELIRLAEQEELALGVAGDRAEQATVRADRAARRAERFGAASEQVAVARSTLADVRRSAAPVVHLAKLARGMAGQRRVALTTYVLRQWFEQVVTAANVRLAGMSSGRYELVRVDEGESRSERTGLTLQVLDRHTGEQRSPRSLSGGETFYTSLALALGLADVVRAEAGGVDLDTLFIDEGFGSLDADTLDQVMTVIDELRGHGRTVGIVSHVSELKHRIAERIEVRRLPDGSSTLQVVA